MPLRASGVATQQAALGLGLLGALALLSISPNMRTLMIEAITSTTGKVITCVFAAWAITTLFSHAPLHSLKIGGRTGLFVLGATLIWAALNQGHVSRDFLYKCLIVTSLTFAVLALLSINGAPYILPILKGEALDREHPVLAFKAFATASMCLIPVVIYASYRLGENWRWYGWLFAPVSVLIIFQTFNRSALAGGIAMVLIVSVLSAVRNRRTRLLLGPVLFFIALSGAWLYMIESDTQLVSGTYAPEWLIDPHRQLIWKFAFERFLDHPLVGNGIDQLNRLPGAEQGVPGLQSSAAQIPSHPHNWVMEILAETGLMGFLPVIFAIVFVTWKLIKRYIANGDGKELALIALMAGFWSSALFNFSIWATWWQLTLFILFAIAAERRPTNQSSD